MDNISKDRNSRTIVQSREEAKTWDMCLDSIVR